ncbi:unnamed protein product [Allacma fusca]|uniref:Peptidase S1 domain-containing protein n=1 Tax=Allacma fusca TaxID=39272 RepID=A0A8J2PN74_9HEXA|nr:unnamed protein product [Allacma fusca]
MFYTARGYFFLIRDEVTIYKLCKLHFIQQLVRTHCYINCHTMLLKVAIFASLAILTAKAFPQGGQLDTANWKVIGGELAKEGQFPYQVAIFENLIGKLYYLCSGTILSSKYVLTSTSCIIGQWPTITIVRTGVIDLEKNSTRGQDYRSWTLITHPNFEHQNHTNDIGIIELEGELELNEHVQPIKLPPGMEEVVENTTCRIAGWGGLNDPNPDNELRFVDLPVVSDRSCGNSYARENQTILPAMLCAGTSGRDLCWGDNGGPLTCADGIVHGIATRGSKCNLSGFPAIFAQVSHYRDFIYEHTGL